MRGAARRTPAPRAPCGEKSARLALLRIRRAGKAIFCDGGRAPRNTPLVRAASSPDSAGNQQSRGNAERSRRLGELAIGGQQVAANVRIESVKGAAPAARSLMLGPPLQRGRSSERD